MCISLQDLKQQTKLLEEQCEAVQQELGWQYLILKQAAKTESRYFYTREECVAVPHSPEIYLKYLSAKCKNSGWL